MPSEISGPFVAVAAICQNVLQEKDNVNSIIRIVDRVTMTATADTPDPLPPVPFSGILYISLKSGTVNATHTIRFTYSLPNGMERPISNISVLFEGEDRGANLVINLQLQFEEHGLHWINVYFEDQLLTRVPMRMIVQRFGTVTS